ncbi:MAG: acyltransferase [Gemmatimonadaceae bacterium]|nr:acyltransferase [Gemmatimonadaceae bacterium]
MRVSRLSETLVKPTDARRTHLPRLDGVRGCAILLVILSHVAGPVTPLGTLDRVTVTVFGAGWIGVDLFFVLSGFLISGILLDSRDDPRYLGTFFARRALRILPPYVLFLIGLTVATAWLRPTPAWDGWLASLPWHLTYLTNLLVALHGWNAAAMQSGHLWSLAVEDQFYLTWPFVVRVGGTRRLRAWIERSLLYLPALRGLALAAGAVTVVVHALTPFRFDSLIAGALLAIAVRSDDERLRRQLRRAGYCAAAALLVIVAARRGLPYNDPWVQTLGYSALAILFASLIESLLRDGDRSLGGRVFGSRVLRSFGRYSYAIYLFHAPLLLVADHLGWARDALPAVGGSRTPALLIYSAMFSAGMWLVGLASWWAYERRFLALKRHFRYERDTRTLPEQVPRPQAA